MVRCDVRVVLLVSWWSWGGVEWVNGYRCVGGCMDVTVLDVVGRTYVLVYAVLHRLAPRRKGHQDKTPSCLTLSLCVLSLATIRGVNSGATSPESVNSVVFFVSFFRYVAWSRFTCSREQWFSTPKRGSLVAEKGVAPLS